MQARALILLILALAMGGITVYMMNSYLQNQVTERQVQETIETTSIVVARVDIKPGTRLAPELLKVVPWPREALPENYFSNINALIGTDKAAPILLREARQGEPILQYFLSPYGARGGLPLRIPEDMRAITVEVNEIRGVAGFALPGNYVDVLHTTKAGRKDEELVTRVILQNIKVLAVDQIASETETNPRVVNAVTLLMTTFDAQRLTLATHLGQIKLALRNDFDASIVEESVTTYKDLITIEKDRPVKVYKRVRRPMIEIIRGLQIEQEAVQEGESPKAQGQQQ